MGTRVSTLPLGAATRQTWAMTEVGATEDINLSQTCVLFSVQPIYIHHTCYFFPQLHGCVLSSLFSIFPEQTLLFSAYLSWEMHLDRDHSSPRRHLSGVCSFQEPGPALPPSPTQPHISLGRNCIHSLGCVNTEFVLPG